MVKSFGLPFLSFCATQQTHQKATLKFRPCLGSLQLSTIIPDPFNRQHNLDVVWLVNKFLSSQRSVSNPEAFSMNNLRDNESGRRSSRPGGSRGGGRQGRRANSSSEDKNSRIVRQVPSLSSNASRENRGQPESLKSEAPGFINGVATEAQSAIAQPGVGGSARALRIATAASSAGSRAPAVQLRHAQETSVEEGEDVGNGIAASATSRGRPPRGVGRAQESWPPGGMVDDQEGRNFSEGGAPSGEESRASGPAQNRRGRRDSSPLLAEPNSGVVDSGNTEVHHLEGEVEMGQVANRRDQVAQTVPVTNGNRNAAMAEEVGERNDDGASVAISRNVRGLQSAMSENRDRVMSSTDGIGEEGVLDNNVEVQSGVNTINRGAKRGGWGRANPGRMYPRYVHPVTSRNEAQVASASSAMPERAGEFSSSGNGRGKKGRGRGGPIGEGKARGSVNGEGRGNGSVRVGENEVQRRQMVTRSQAGRGSQQEENSRSRERPVRSSSGRGRREMDPIEALGRSM